MESKSLATLVIDTLQFARDGRAVSGDLPVSALPRLLEMMGQAAASALHCKLTGRRDTEGKTWLRVQVDGSLVLACQRCLGDLAHELRIDSEVQVIASGDPWPDEVLDDGGLAPVEDAIEAEPALSVAGLIEDEVLLALPIAPRHEQDDPVCIPRVGASERLEASPFAVLAGLKKH